MHTSLYIEADSCDAIGDHQSPRRVYSSYSSTAVQSNRLRQVLSIGLCDFLRSVFRRSPLFNHYRWVKHRPRNVLYSCKYYVSLHSGNDDRNNDIIGALVRKHNSRSVSFTSSVSIVNAGASAGALAATSGGNEGTFVDTGRAPKAGEPGEDVEKKAGEEVVAAAGGAFSEELGVLDEEQAAMMAEECILVDRNDRPTGSASKVKNLLPRVRQW